MNEVSPTLQPFERLDPPTDCWPHEHLSADSSERYVVGVTCGQQVESPAVVGVAAQIPRDAGLALVRNAGHGTRDHCVRSRNYVTALQWRDSGIEP